ncbi:MAG: hypothetical protein AAB649_00240, partial [Patescibacteria group bacterium]
MKIGQVILSWIVTLLYFALLGEVAYLVLIFVPGAIIPCIALETVITLILLVEIVKRLSDDTMIVLSFVGYPFKVYSPKNEHGIWDTGFVPAYPPGLVTAHELPIDVLIIPFQSNGATTKERKGIDDDGNEVVLEAETPVTVLSELTLGLPETIEALRSIIQDVGILGGPKRQKLNAFEIVNYFKDYDKTGELKVDPRLVPRI